MKELLTPKFNYARNAEHYQVHAENLNTVPETFADEKGIGTQRKAYDGLFREEDAIYMRNRSYKATKDVEGGDDNRDILFDVVKSRIDKCMNHPVEAIKEAAIALEYVLKPYRNAKTLPYAENTAQVANFADEMLSPENAAYIEALGLTVDMQRLREANEAFNTIWVERSDEMLSRKEADNMKAIRPKVDGAYRELTDALYTLYKHNELIAKDPDIKAEFETIIDRLNAITLQLNSAISRRSSGSASTSE